MDSLYGKRILYTEGLCNEETDFKPSTRVHVMGDRGEDEYYDFPDTTWFELRWSSENIRYGSLYQGLEKPKPTQNRTCCKYCGGTTIDDERGNCFACGAPRPKPITCVTMVD